MKSNAFHPMAVKGTLKFSVRKQSSLFLWLGSTRFRSIQRVQLIRIFPSIHSSRPNDQNSNVLTFVQRLLYKICWFSAICLISLCPQYKQAVQLGPSPRSTPSQEVRASNEASLYQLVSCIGIENADLGCIRTSPF